MLRTKGFVVTKSMRLLPKVTKVRAGETGRWLRALAVLREEDPDPAPIWRVTAKWNSGSRRPDSLFRPPQVSTHIYT